MELELLRKILGINGCIVKDYLIEDKKIIFEIESSGFPICPKCRQYHLEAPKDRRIQTIEDLSICGKRLYLKIQKRRIDCSCGYHGTESIEWLERYSRYTTRYQKFIYQFCKRMTGKDVSIIFGISKNTVYDLDKECIEHEMLQQEMIKPKRISVDEISRKKGHVYASIISAPDEKKILDVVKGRKFSDLAPFFKEKGQKWCSKIESASMDAWLAYRKVIKKYCKKAVICFDHFHLAQYFSRAIDSLRISEARKADKSKKEIFTGIRWLLLKRPEKLNEDQAGKLNQLLEMNKNLFKAYILRDEFRNIFAGQTKHSRLMRLTSWLQKAKTVRIPQIKEFVRLIEKWEPYIRNSLREGCSNSFAEGINTKIRVIQRMAYGYKDFDYFRLKIIQQFNFRDIRSVFDD